MALATAFAPMVLPAPGRFSTITGTFHLSFSLCASARATASTAAAGIERHHDPHRAVGKFGAREERGEQHAKEGGSSNEDFAG